MGAATIKHYVDWFVSSLCSKEEKYWLTIWRWFYLPFEPISFLSLLHCSESLCCPNVLLSMLNTRDGFGPSVSDHLSWFI